MKFYLREEALKLRLKGLSYSEIQQLLPIPQSTLQGWIHEVKLTLSQKNRLLLKQSSYRLLGSQVLNQERIRRTKEIIGKAISEVKNLINNPLWLTGTILYWAEGHKQKKHNTSQCVSFTNSDPLVIKIYLKWLKSCLKIDDDELVFEIYIHETYQKSKEQLIKYWTEVTKFPSNKFDNIYYKKNKVYSYRKNRGDNYCGVLRIWIRRSTDLNRKITGWIEGICTQCGINSSREI